MFSKVELSDTYLLMKAGEVCLKLLPINTQKGLYKLNHLSFGLKAAPSLFQQVMDTMLAGLEFASAYLNDIQLRSENNKKHKNLSRQSSRRLNMASS